MAIKDSITPLQRVILLEAGPELLTLVERILDRADEMAKESSSPVPDPHAVIAGVSVALEFLATHNLIDPDAVEKWMTTS